MHRLRLLVGHSVCNPVAPLARSMARPTGDVLDVLRRRGENDLLAPIGHA